MDKKRIRPLWNFLFFGNSQLILAVLVLVGFVALRVLMGPGIVPTDQMAYSSSRLDCPGAVIYSSEAGRLLLNQDELLLCRRPEAPDVLASEVVNLYTSGGDVLVKAAKQVHRLDWEAAELKPIAAPAAIPAGARLVGVGEYGTDYYVDGEVYADGATYQYTGTRKHPLVESEWRGGALFFSESSWTVYREHQPRINHILPLERGIIVSAHLAPDGSRVIFATVNNMETEVWVADSSGGNARLLFSQAMEFSSLEVVWAEDSRQAAFSVLGFEDQETYLTATIIYQPGNAALELHSYQGEFVNALLPTAWGGDGRSVYFINPSEEQQRPYVFSLYRN
ncbi:MAG: hypothetical protein FH749_10200 [Firmicutes bacterium]|nr:hypothetical protein [Bacillota bacterium]